MPSSKAARGAQVCRPQVLPQIYSRAHHSLQSSTLFALGRSGTGLRGNAGHSSRACRSRIRAIRTRKSPTHDPFEQKAEGAGEPSTILRADGEPGTSNRVAIVDDDARIREALAQGAAARLGVNRTTLINKMTKLGIARPPPPSSVTP